MSWNDTVIEQFRAGDARIADMFDRGALALLHTTGAKSGEPRISPLAYFRDGDGILLVASAAGAERHPAWYHNLLANPKVQVEIWEDDKLTTIAGSARTADEGEHKQLWDQITAVAPGFAEYQTKTSRKIPVVVVEPVSG